MTTAARASILHHEFEIIIPTQCKCGKPLPGDERKTVITHVKRTMSEWYGGITHTPSQGGWFNADGNYVEEEVDIIFSNANASGYEAHREEFVELIAEMGNRLSQDVAAGRVDGKLFTFRIPAGKCIHETKRPPLKHPITSSEPTPLDRKRSILSGLHQLNSLNQARSLFINILHYEFEDSSLPTHGWPESLKNCLAPGSEPLVIAEQNGFKIIYLKLPEERLRRPQERQLIERILRDLPDMRGLVVVSDVHEREWHLVNVKYSIDEDQKAKFSLRRMRVGPNEYMRTAVERLALIDIDELGEELGAADIQAAHDGAFDVQAVTKEFFATYETVFLKVEAAVKGFGRTEKGIEQRRLFTQQLFNRLLFLAFIQRKGWLTIDGQTDYLAAFWNDYQATREKGDNFWADRLRRLFFIALNNKDGINITAINDGAALSGLIGRVPFLNGGLFEETEMDRMDSLKVPDEAIRTILFDLFGRFNFTVTESTPLDQEVAIDPEMLGTIFERLVTGRHESGSYYTPKPIVSFMFRETLKCHLIAQCPAESASGIEEFVENHDASNIGKPEKILAALQSITVCDPACGSGAYLLGMLHELMDLRDCLFVAHKVGAREAYDRKLEIIQTNLYGVDIDPFAVNIARLRLWLSLAVEYEVTDAEPPPALPNLDFKIEIGDSLLAPDPQQTDNLFRKAIFDQADKLIGLKTDYLVASGPQKKELARKIQAEEAELASTLEDDPAPDGSFDWRVGFAEVFRHGGFDIVIGNPPYVRIQELKRTNPGLLKALREDYHAAGKGNYDLYVVFVERGVQLIRSTGQLAFILPHKFFNAQYGEPLRKFISNAQYLRKVVHFGDEQVFDGVTNYVCLLFLSKAGARSMEWVRVDDLEEWLRQGRADSRVFQSDRVTASEWCFSVGKGANLFDRIISFPVPLESVAHIFVGLQTSADKVFLFHEHNEIDEKYTEVFSRTLGEKTTIETELLKPVVRSGHIRRFHAEATTLTLFPYRVRDAEAMLLPAPDLKKSFPLAWSYLNRNRSLLEGREKGAFKDSQWYRYGRAQNLGMWEQPKVMVPYMITELGGYLDDSESLYFVNVTTGGFGITTSDCRVSLPYLCVLLNSNLLNFVAPHTNLCRK